MRPESILEALAEGMAGDERLILCGFAGDPNTASPNAWRPRPWRPGAEIPFSFGDNVYTTVASFGRADDGTFRRRQSTFRAGRALMIDDIGTKVDRSAVADLPPSFIVETSPGNEQWWYILAEPCRDMYHFDAVIRAFIAGKLLGNDPGMAGVNRVGRLPGYTNGKEKYNGFRTRLVEWTDRRFTIPQLVTAFRLELMGEKRPAPSRGFILAEHRERIPLFEKAMRLVNKLGMVKGREFDPSGWVEVTCPWIDDHSNRADTGAAVRRPNAENEFYGAFRCHHGHCADRGWGDLSEWAAEQAAGILEKVNDKGMEFEELNP